jgi:hypothetical protein
MKITSNHAHYARIPFDMAAASTIDTITAQEDADPRTGARHHLL